MLGSARVPNAVSQVRLSDPDPAPAAYGGITMPQQWVYARDQITINSDLAALIVNEAAGHLAAGDTIVLAARTCAQDPAFLWKPQGFNVLVVADSYLYGAGQGQGGIDVSGTTPTTVAGTGDTGSPGVASADNPIDGGPGGAGQAGAAGGASTSITVLARTLDPVTLRACGGAGVQGGAGGPGGPGARGRIINRHPPIVIEGAPGGPGGSGGAGGAGAAGGAVTVVYVTPGPRGTPRYAPACAAGGAGGAGGVGGVGGSGGTATGAPGPAGPAGPAGANAPVSVVQGDDTAYWSAVASTLTAAGRYGWANHRLRVGRYLYRTFNAGDAAHSGDLLLAYREFRAVMNLGGPDSAQAAQWSGWLANNLNALGLPYDLWLKPDFDAFEATYVGYAPLIAPLVLAVSQLIAAAINGSAINTQLGLMQTEASNERSALVADQTAAARAVTDSQSLLNDLNGQMATLQGQITAQQVALDQARYQFASGLPATAALDVLSAVFSVAVPAAAPVMGLVGLIQPVWAEVTKGFTIESLLGSKGKDPVITAAGDLSGLVGKSAPLLSLFKNLDENNNTTITGDQAAIRALTAKAIDLKFQLLRQQDDLAEAQLRLAAVQAHINACDNDIAAVKAAGQINVGQMSAVADVVGQLVDTIARVSEFVVRYVFLAARALDVFAFADGSVVAPALAPPRPATNVATLALDFGIVSPDVIADALLELRRGGTDAGTRQANAQRCLTLLATLANNWAQAPAWSTFTQRGTDLANSLAPGHVWVPITDPAVLSQLRATGTATFSITAANLPGDATELKISRIYLNLIGATSTVPSLNGSLTHGGYAQAIRRDGATMLLGSPPMTSFVSVGLASGQVPAPPTKPPGGAAAGTSPVAGSTPPGGKAAVVSGATRPTYYARSPIAPWSFTVADPTPVDLSGVTQIQVGLDFLAVPGTPPRPVLN